MKKLLDRKHLDIVRTVHELGSLTAAAEQLHLTQSALSHSMRKLEDQLGTPIWRRDGRNLYPTQAGVALLRTAQRVLPQLERTEQRLRQIANGERGTLSFGMECHPCYQWLLKVVKPFLQRWPDVDVDLKQKFQFGGIAALLACDIDLLVTPDPLHRPGLAFTPVFDYEQVLVIPQNHPLSAAAYATPHALSQETLITYPVSPDRLDVFSQFLTPAGLAPKRHKTIETTDIMLQMVASGRGVAALPRWLVEDNLHRFAVRPLQLGEAGISKQIHLGYRLADSDLDYLHAFLDLAKNLGR